MEGGRETASSEGGPSEGLWDWEDASTQFGQKTGCRDSKGVWVGDSGSRCRQRVWEGVPVPGSEGLDTGLTYHRSRTVSSTSTARDCHARSPTPTDFGG